jgi:hypothetical protein
MALCIGELYGADDYARVSCGRGDIVAKPPSDPVGIFYEVALAIPVRR